MTPRFSTLGILSLSALMGLLPGLAKSAEWQPVGEATAYWAGLIPVYDAQLEAPSDVALNTLLSDDTPLKLQLCYRVKLTQSEFIQAAEQALPKSLSPAHQKAVNSLHQRYQTVQPNDCYQLVYAPQTGVELRLNNVVQYRDKTPGFKAVYFGIWLGDAPLSDSVKADLTEKLPPSTDQTRTES